MRSNGEIYKCLRNAMNDESIDFGVRWFRDEDLSGDRLLNLLPKGNDSKLTPEQAVRVLEFVVEFQNVQNVLHAIPHILENLGVRGLENPNNRKELLFSRRKTMAGRFPWTEDTDIQPSDFDFDGFLAQLDAFGDSKMVPTEYSIDKEIADHKKKPSRLFKSELLDANKRNILPNLIGYYALLALRLAEKKPNNYYREIGVRNGVRSRRNPPYLIKYNQIYRDQVNEIDMPVFHAETVNFISFHMDVDSLEIFKWVVLSATNIMDQAKPTSPITDDSMRDGANVLTELGMNVIQRKGLPAWSLTQKVANLYRLEPHQVARVCLDNSGWAKYPFLRVYQFVYRYIATDGQRREMEKRCPWYSRMKEEYSIYWPCARVCSSEYLTAVNRKNTHDCINVLATIHDLSESEESRKLANNNFVLPGGGPSDREIKLARINIESLRKLAR